MRPAAAVDAPTVTAIYIDSWNLGFGHLMGIRRVDDERVERMRRDFSNPAEDWTVAELEGVAVGFVCIGPSREPRDPDLGELQAIHVDPIWWRRGVGTALMSHALGDLEQRWSGAILWTPAGHDGGHAFYRATGWEELDQSRADGTEVAFGHTLSLER